ncbi:transposon TX1 [Tanacetum coccineum]
MGDPNITMEEYIRLEEEKARRGGKVYNWETATYGKIWDNEDVHDLGSVETEFPAIVFNETLTSEATLSCEPTVSSLNNDEIDFRISFDESDDEDYTVIFDKNSFSHKIISVNDLKTDSENDNEKVNMPLLPSPESTVKMGYPNITMEEYIRLEEEKARRHGKVYNWETATYGKIWDNEDVHDLRSVETEFPAIVFNKTLTSEATLSCEPTVSSLNNDEIDFRISFDESDDEDYTVANPIGLGDFRPISLIGCYYKSIVKLLAERVKRVVGTVVGDVHNAFIKGRYILDGILIANETVDYLKKSKEKGLIFKVDFEKAYDSLNWRFLQDIMKRMAFGEKWCNWVEYFLRFASMSILVSGSPTEEFCLERGVRQGDPLSPLLFILAAEGLNAIVNEAVEHGIFRGVKVGRNRVVVSHLQYADDTIFLENGTKRMQKRVDDLELGEMARWMSCGVGDELEGLGIDFDCSFKGDVGDGSDIRFWVDRWIGDVRLCDRFPRLYHLDRRKEGGVGDKGRWKLTLNDDGEFMVKELTKMIEEKILRVERSGEVTLWNKWVPKKVNIFIWRALKGRLPVREELDKRGIDLYSLLCPCCDTVVESCNHTLVLCNLAWSVLERIYRWWKLGNVNAFSIEELYSFNGNVNIPTQSSSLWQAVIWTSGYYIWKERNSRVFRNKVSSINKIIQDIQLKSYEWIVRRLKKKSVMN